MGRFLCGLLLVCVVSVAAADDATPLPPDTPVQRLLTAIRAIPIIDNHAHPALNNDPEMRALTFAPQRALQMPPAPLPIRLHPTSPEYAHALHALYGDAETTPAAAHIQELQARRQQQTATGSTYFNHVLDTVGITLSLANRVGMNNAPLDRDRFQWVPYVDAYVFPLNNTVYKKMNADYQVFFSGQEYLLQRYLDQVETSRPRTFQAYLQFVVESLRRLKAEGAIALTFEIAHLRTLRFDDPPQRQARRVYERYYNSSEVPEEEYRLLQDYLFGYVLRQATKLGFPLQVYCGLGAGEAFSLAGAHPLQLEKLLNDPQYHQTTFILLNGGYPFTRETIHLAGKPHVYVDLSTHPTLVLHPIDLARILKEWLTLYPEKILFGSGATVVNEQIGAAETYWLAVETVRHALAIALSEMIAEGRCDESEALRLARLVLHDNAAKLYRLP